MYKHIIVPIDGSELSKNAVLNAVSFAKEINAKITFFCAKKPIPFMYCGVGAIFDSHAIGAFNERIDESTNNFLDDAISIAVKSSVSCNKISIIHNEPYVGIIDTAIFNKCDLIFMASHGYSGLDGILLGSETQKVLTHSKIPVLVYR